VQEDAREDRDREQWPGRKPSDERVRSRLKSLFAATDDPAALEALISDRGREIEEQAQRLQLTIENLEQREEQAARLRAAIEEMLRHGSAELDERHAALAALSHELAAREEKLRVQDAELALRRQELGAVELRRAAVERREEAAAIREAALYRAGTAVGETDPTDDASAATEHVLVLADGGWRMVERDGPVPPPDSAVEVDGRTLVVVRVGRPMLADDRRPRVYLEPAREPATR